ncbi:MAG TPA: hypothetical protein VFB19_17275 [Mycobacterium sp.]|nr:hypothetical protein [Mycobacterium sp.]
MTLAADSECSGQEFFVEDVTTGIYANGFGRIGDGRSFAFHTEHHQLVVEVYRPRLAGPVPNAEDVVATATRRLGGIDVTDARSLVAAVRDAVANAQPVQHGRWIRRRGPHSG